MIGKPGYGQGLSVYLLRKQRVAAAVALLLGLALQCLDLHAELLFRSALQVNGQQKWSPVRKYSNPPDIAYARVSAGGAEEVRVILSGTITRADMDSAAVMENLIKNGKQKIAGNAVWLASDGGDIDVGMELGRLLRKLGIFTFVGENDRCLSACVFAFMGGERRSVAGQIGIHRPYFPFTEALDRQARFRYLKKVLKAYFEEMDFPDSLFEAVMLAPPESMQILTPADLKRYYLEGISPLTEDMVDAASARRLKISMLEYLKRKAMAPACDFFDAGVGRCDGKVQAAASSRGAVEEPGSKQAANAPSAGHADAIPAGLPMQPRNPPRIDSRGPI